MSGGSWDYFSGSLNDVSSRLINEKSASEYELRVALGRWLRLVEEALHMIEWVDSGDCSPGDERAALLAVFGKNAPQVELRELSTQLKDLGRKIHQLEDKQ